MIKWIFLSVISAVTVLAVYLYFYLGAYKPVEFHVEQAGPFHLLYQNHQGPYHQIMPKIQAAEAWAREHHLPCPRTYGEYLDDPQGVDQDRLRSHAGCLLGSVPGEKPPASFTYEERPERRYAVARFTGSPSIGPFKVYPKLEAFLQRERLASSPDPVIEIYRINGDQVETEYLFPLAN